MMTSSARRTIAATVAFFVVSQVSAETPNATSAPSSPTAPSAMTQWEMEQRAERRFPQPVRVGVLLDRILLMPKESHPVLGRVVGFRRRSPDAIGVSVRLDGWLGLGWLGARWISWSGFGSRVVDVPLEAVALLGEQIALMDLKPDDLRALPTSAPNPSLVIGPDEMIDIGLTAPFH